MNKYLGIYLATWDNPYRIDLQNYSVELGDNLQ